MTWYCAFCQILAELWNVILNGYNKYNVSAIATMKLDHTGHSNDHAGVSVCSCFGNQDVDIRHIGIKRTIITQYCYHFIVGNFARAVDWLKHYRTCCTLEPGVLANALEQYTSAVTINRGTAYIQDDNIVAFPA